MTWPDTTIDNWEKLTQQAKRLTSVADLVLFRGQPRTDQDLRPSITREAVKFKLSAEHVIAIEQVMMTQFQQVAHLYFPASVLPKTAGTVDWWTLMQHHRAPTRLLDWTHSPYVATYFACIDDWDHDGVVWWVDGVALEAEMKNQYDDSEWGPMLTNPEAPQRIHTMRGTATERILAQRGVFTVCTQVLADHADAIEGALKSSAQATGRSLFGRWIIPAEERRSILEQLRAANITAASLFPGADGLGLSLKEMLMMRMEQLRTLSELVGRAELASISMEARSALTKLGKVAIENLTEEEETT